jgi:hypothetical protein
MVDVKAQQPRLAALSCLEDLVKAALAAEKGGEAWAHQARRLCEEVQKADKSTSVAASAGRILDMLQQ